MRVPKVLRSTASFLKELYTEFGSDNSGMMAAAVSFYVYMSLTPLLVIGVAAFGFVLRSDERAYQNVVTILQTNLPGLGEQSQVLAAIIRGSTAATGFGIVSLLWAGSQAVVNLELAVNIAWDCKPRSFIKQRLTAIALLMAVAALLLISFGVTTAANAIQSHSLVVLGHNVLRWFGWAWKLLAFLLPILVSIGAFTLIFEILPNTRVPLKTALVGGVITGVLWELAKHAFSWYVTHFAHYNVIYGSLAGVILLLVWIYYSSLVTIVGAQISAIYNRRHVRRHPT